MKNQKLFKDTTATLVEAFFDGTLKKGDCQACAVGNICGQRPDWASVFVTIYGHQSFELGAYRGTAKEVIDDTGYSPTQLARIEAAFESNTDIHYRDYENDYRSAVIEDQFSGLMAVMDVLFDIHDVEVEEQSDYRQQFKEHPQLETV